MCYYFNLHTGHKVILINDEELLKKENISIEKSSVDFKNIIEKAIILKEKIEKEIIEIDKLYNKINNELKNVYEKRHEKLIKEEKDLREKL